MTGFPQASADLAPSRVAAGGIDVWDVTAQLESRGFSERVAREQGFGSVFEAAERLIDEVPAPDQDAARARIERPGRASLPAAIGRTAVMIGGVVVCATSIPSTAPELTVFLMAAGGWLFGQAVSAATWHAWGGGHQRDGIAAGGASAAVLLLVGVIATAVVGLPEALIWVGIAVATPLLLLLGNGRVTALVGLGAAAVCGLSWLARNQYAGIPAAFASWGLPVAVAVTTVAVVAAFVLVWRHLRGSRPRYVAGTTRAVLVSVLQTLFQLAILLQIFLNVGAGPFGAVAVAVVTGGILTDPLLTIQMAWARGVSQRSTSWHRGRLRIGVVAVGMVAIILAASAWTAVALLSDPYRVTLNEPTVIAAVLLSAAVVAATNTLLRTGSGFAAMLFAAVAAVLIGATTVTQADETLGFGFMLVATVIVSGLAVYLAAFRFGHPSTW